MERLCAALVGLLLLVAVTATAVDESIPVPVVPVEDGEVFLEMSTHTGYGCAKGFRCPIVDGACCPNGKACCPDRCVHKNDTAFECRPSDERLSERKLYEVFMRKQMLDKQEDQMAKEQEQDETKYVQETKHKKEVELWKAKVNFDSLKLQNEAEKQKKEMVSKLKNLAEAQGESLQQLLSPDVVKALGLEKAVYGPSGKPDPNVKLLTPDQVAKFSNSLAQEEENHKKLTALNPMPPWSNFGSYYDVLRVQRWRNICFLSGMLSGEGKMVGKVPEACRPLGGRLVFSVLRNNKPARVDILSSGQIEFVFGSEKSLGNKAADYLSLSGIAYDINNGSATFLTNGWVNYRREYQDTYITNIGDMCMMTGVIRSGIWTKIGEVSKECAPETNVIMFALNNAQDMRVDITPNRTIQFAPGAKHTSHWASMSNIIYTRRPGQPLALLHKWTNHVIKGNKGAKYRAASFARVGNMVTLSGLVKPGEGGHLATLPPGFRPFDRLAFATGHNNGLTRIDITKEGHVVYVAGRIFDWVVLDGINFFAYRTDKELMKQEEAGFDAQEAQRTGAKPGASQGKGLGGVVPFPGESAASVANSQRLAVKDQVSSLVTKLHKMATVVKSKKGGKRRKKRKTADADARDADDSDSASDEDSSESDSDYSEREILRYAQREHSDLSEREIRRYAERELERSSESE